MDKTKIFETAGKFAAKGQLEKAAKEYHRVLEEDPKDVRALQKLAELYQKNNKPREAADLLLRVAEGYGEQGFFLKAVAVYKQVLKLGSDRIDVNLKLAQIYQQLGLVGDATQQYQIVANHHDRSGNVRESLAALRRLVDLDPDNVDSRRNLAELYARERMVAESVAEFRRAAAYLRKNNRHDEYVRVLERVGQLLPEDAAVARELAQLLLGQGESKRALAKLQVCFRQNPKDIETLQLLARAFSDLGQSAKTVSVYRELAHVHAEAGQTDACRRTLQAILQLVPGDPEASDALAGLERGGRDAGTLPPPAAAPTSPVMPAPAPAARPAPPPARPSAEAAGLPASVVKVLTETDVYLKYNLIAKAAEHVRRAVIEAPDALPVQEKLLAILDRQGKTDEAVGVLAKLVELARASGEPEVERGYLQDLGQRDPSHPLVAEAARAADLGPELVEADDADLAAAALAREAVEEDEFAEAIEVDTEPTMPPAALQGTGAGPLFSTLPAADPAASPDELAETDAPAAESASSPAFDDPFERSEPVAADAMVDDDPFGEAPVGAAPAEEGLDPFAIVRGVDDDDDEVVVLEDEIHEDDFADARAALAALAALAAHDGHDSEDGAPVAIEADEGTALPAVEPAPAVAEELRVPDDERFAEELDEAEFLLQQGLDDDARAAIEDILAQAPTHARANELHARLGGAGSGPAPEEAPAVVAPPAAAAPGDDEGFDLARELADEFDISETPRPGSAPGLSVAGVLDDLRRRPGEAGSGEDAQTHYDLGIAYKEMGLHDEAVHEFEVALQGRGRRRVIDCLTMIGVCRMEKGQHREAIGAFETALKTPGLNLEGSKEAHYEIGRCHEQLGDEPRALDHYARVFKADPAFRDVKARVGRLGPRVRGKADGAAHGSNGAARPATNGAARAGGSPAEPAPQPPPAGTQPPAEASRAAAGGRGGKIGYI